MTVWDLDPERAGTTQQKIDCHVWSRPTLILALWLCDLLAQSLQLGSISLYIADKNHLPVWPLPWATTGISPVKRFRSRGAEVASKVESHWGCSSKKPTGLMRIKTMGCLWAVYGLSIGCPGLIHALKYTAIGIQEQWEGPALPSPCNQEVVEAHLQ